MKKAVILTANQFDERELFYAFYRLKEEGFEVDVAASTTDEVKGKFGIPIRPTVDFNSLDAKRYSMVIVPGGYAPDRIRQDKDALKFIKDMNDGGKIVSGTCHGPWVLASAGVLKGRNATCYSGCKDDIVNAGAIYSNKRVVVDRNIVTAQHYDDNPEWMRETINAFKKPQN